MTTKTDVSRNTGLKLKASSGWFAAGISFKRALTLLSDGAFKLFAFVAIEADRRTGCFEATQTELARVLKKSRRVIGRYIAELEPAGICIVSTARNQYARNKFEILDEYWPYDRTVNAGNAAGPEEDAYVVAVRDKFLKTGCTRGTFGTDDAKAARALRERGVPLTLVQDALNLGACRKYDSWLNGGKSQPIGSLAYFAAVVSEIQKQPLPQGYAEYLQGKVVRISTAWAQASTNRPKSGDG